MDEEILIIGLALWGAVDLLELLSNAVKAMVG